MFWLHAELSSRLALSVPFRDGAVGSSNCRESKRRQFGLHVPGHTIVGIGPAVAGTPSRRPRWLRDRSAFDGSRGDDVTFLIGHVPWPPRRPGHAPPARCRLPTLRCGLGSRLRPFALQKKNRAKHLIIHDSRSRNRWITGGGKQEVVANRHRMESAAGSSKREHHADDMCSRYVHLRCRPAKIGKVHVHGFPLSRE